VGSYAGVAGVRFLRFALGAISLDVSLLLAIHIPPVFCYSQLDAMCSNVDIDGLTPPLSITGSPRP
jgi:hypothetical protein